MDPRDPPVGDGDAFASERLHSGEGEETRDLASPDGPEQRALGALERKNLESALDHGEQMIGRSAPLEWHVPLSDHPLVGDGGEPGQAVGRLVGEDIENVKVVGSNHGVARRSV